MRQIRQRMLQALVVRVIPHQTLVGCPCRCWRYIGYPYERTISGLRMQDSVVPSPYALLAALHLQEHVIVSCAWHCPLSVCLTVIV